MISQVNSVLSKYCNLFMKMALDSPIIASNKSNLRLLIFVCDFIKTIKLHEGDVHLSYVVS
jgi:hypothetical protein